MMIGQIIAPLRDESIFTRFLHSSAKVAFGNGFARFATFASVALSARLLGSQDFGVYGVVQSTILITVVVGGMGQEVTNRKYVGEFRKSDKARCGDVIALTISSSLAFGLAGLVLLELSAPYLANSILINPDIVEAIRISGLIVLFRIVNQAMTGALAGYEDFGQLAFLYLARGATTLLLVPVSALYFGVLGLLGGLALVEAISAVLSGVLLTVRSHMRGIRITLRGVRNELGLIWSFSGPSMIAVVIPTVVLWMAKTILARQPGGYAELGVFAAAEQWMMVIGFLPTSINYVSVSILSNLLADRERTKFIRATRISVVAPAILAALVALAVGTFSGQISLIYGNSYSGIVPVLIVISVVSVMKTIGESVGSWMASIAKMWWGVLFNLIWGSVLLGTLAFTSHMGAMGLGFAYIAAYSISSVSALAFVYFVSKRILVGIAYGDVASAA